MRADRRRWLWIAAAIVIVVAAAAWWWFQQRQPAPVTVEPEAEVPAAPARPAPVAYEFDWRDGAVRGIDLPSHIRIPGRDLRLPLYPVGDMRSEAGEDKLDFLRRVRRTLASYSDRQTYEACAEICTDGETYSVRITSTAAVLFCAVAPVCMEGQHSTNEAIHSHCPHRFGLRTSKADEALSGGMFHSGGPFGRCDTEHFSATDFAAGRSGWLAGRRSLYWQDGPDKVERFPR